MTAIQKAREEREHVAFHEWWKSSGHEADATFTMTMQNCAHAAWQARSALAALDAETEVKWVTVRVEDTCDGLLINAEDMKRFNLRDDVQYPGEMTSDGRFRISRSALVPPESRS